MCQQRLSIRSLLHTQCHKCSERKYFKKNYNIQKIQKFIKDMEFDDSHISDVDELVKVFEDKARAVIDQHAPEITKTITMRENNPWFTKEVGQQKRVVRRTERAWKRGKENVQWKALCVERAKYRELIKETKRKVLNEKIKYAGQDTKELYKVFNNITGLKRENPMPENKTN